MLTILALCLFAAPQAPKYDDARQVLWQRSLDDALALAQAEQRPLLVAINADGESGSERIVREQYRDAAWVAHTRPFICVVGSIFRHNPRDYDDLGRRIACPRLGEITCGEHIALEPRVHEGYFAATKIELFGEQVERISPRHALIAPDGTKTLDMYLLFDMRELERALAKAGANVVAATGSHAVPRIDHRYRLSFENSLAAERDIAAAWASLEGHCLPLLGSSTAAKAAFSAGGDRGWIDALRRLQPRANDFEHAQLERLAVLGAATARETSGALRDAVLSGACASWIEPLAVLGKDQPAMRALALSFAALGSREGGAHSERSSAIAGLHATFGAEVAHSVVNAIDAVGGAFDPSEFTRALTASRPAQAHSSRPQDPLPDAAELEAALEVADAARASDPDGERAFGQAALLLARRRLQDNATNGLDLLLQDADAALARASQAHPDDAVLLLDRARVANYLSRFDEQEQRALEALKVLHFEPNSAPESLDDASAEALRWLGDACARQLGARAGGDPVTEAVGILRGGRSLAFAAASRESDATDWLSVTSFFGALGRARERVALAEEGLYRFPESNELRAELWSALSSQGRPELLVAKSEDLARKFSSSASSAWYAGFALVLHAEWLRRGEDADGAIAAYERCATHFRRAIELEPSFRDSSEHYLALSALGRGFAHLLANDQVEASRCAVEAAALRPEIFTVRDGLDRAAVDLIDGVLEWRASGPSPVDALTWLEQFKTGFAKDDPADDEWLLAISDAELREGLRADGRGERELAERYLAAAIEAARLGAWTAHEFTPSGARTFAQAATIQAERFLADGGDRARIATLLWDAAEALGRAHPTIDAGLAEWKALAAELRAELGEARPVLRAGR